MKRIKGRKRPDIKIRTGDDPALSTPCRPVTDNENISNDIQRMRWGVSATQDRQASGVGLAANQLGILKRIIVVRLSINAKDTWVEMINPEITWKSKDTTKAVEGCLSYPGKSTKVKRYNTVIVSYQDEDREERRLQLKNFEARIVQHEIDHLNGACKVKPNYK